MASQKDKDGNMYTVFYGPPMDYTFKEIYKLSQLANIEPNSTDVFGIQDN